MLGLSFCRIHSTPCFSLVAPMHQMDSPPLLASFDSLLSSLRLTPSSTLHFYPPLLSSSDTYFLASLLPPSLFIDTPTHLHSHIPNPKSYFHPSHIPPIHIFATHITTPPTPHPTLILSPHPHHHPLSPHTHHTILQYSTSLHC